MTTQPRDYAPPRQTEQPPSEWHFAGLVACVLGFVLMLMALVVFVGWLAFR